MLAGLGLVLLLVAPAPAQKKAAPATHRWVVSKSVSKMDDSQTVTLALRANAPVSGWPRTIVTPTLILRCKEGEIDAYVNAQLRPNVEYGNTEGATVQVRFDKTPARRMSTTQSTDGEALFFADAKGTISTMLQHRSMLFRFTPFNSDPQETTFTLTGLGTAIRPLLAACEWDPEKERREAAALELEIILERIQRLQSATSPDDRRARAAEDLADITWSDVHLVVPALLKGLSDPWYPVRSHSARGLGNIGPRAAEAIPAIDRLLASEKDDRVIDAAKEALVKIRGGKAKQY